MRLGGEDGCGEVFGWGGGGGVEAVDVHGCVDRAEERGGGFVEGVQGEESDFMGVS